MLGNSAFLNCYYKKLHLGKTTRNMKGTFGNWNLNCIKFYLKILTQLKCSTSMARAVFFKNLPKYFRNSNHLLEQGIRFSKQTKVFQKITFSYL